MAPSTAAVLVLLSSIQVIAAHGNEHDRWARRNHGHPNLFVERADPYPTTGPEYSIPPLASIVPTPADYSVATLPVPTTYTAGTQPSLTGAPPLPSGTYQYMTSLTSFIDGVNSHGKCCLISHSGCHPAHKHLRGAGMDKRHRLVDDPRHPTDILPYLQRCSECTSGCSGRSRR
jgi:hypothetical protein